MTVKKQKNFKGYRFKDSTVHLLNQMVDHENTKPENAMLSDISERELVENAIEYYHSAMFGEEVLDLRLDRLSENIANQINLMLRPLIEVLGSSVNTQFLKIETTAYMIGVYLHMLKFDFSQFDGETDIPERMVDVKKMVDVITEALIEAKDL